MSGTALRLLAVVGLAALLACAEAATKCSAGACCDTARGVVKAQGEVCSDGHPCAAAAQCDGLTPVCPKVKLMSNGTRCTWYSRSHPQFGSYMSDATKLMRVTVPAAQIAAFMGAASTQGYTAAGGGAAPKKWKPCLGVCMAGQCVMQRQAPLKANELQCCHTGLQGHTMAGGAPKLQPLAAGDKDGSGKQAVKPKAAIQQAAGGDAAAGGGKEEGSFFCWHNMRR